MAGMQGVFAQTFGSGMDSGSGDEFRINQLYRRTALAGYRSFDGRGIHCELGRLSSSGSRTAWTLRSANRFRHGYW